jgi:hypothetical protein
VEADALFQPGERIIHHEFGQGWCLILCEMVTCALSLGLVNAAYLLALCGASSRTERILRAVDGGADRARKAWLSYEAHALPVMESASALTSAKIDLLPHQVVLTHRIATASPTLSDR